MSNSNQPEKHKNPLITQLLEDIQSERAKVKRLKAKLLKYETPNPEIPPVQSLNLEKKEEKETEKPDDDDF